MRDDRRLENQPADDNLDLPRYADHGVHPMVSPVGCQRGFLLALEFFVNDGKPVGKTELTWRRWGRIAGPLCALAVYFVFQPSISAFSVPAGASQRAAGSPVSNVNALQQHAERTRVTASLAVWIAVWWITEAVPLPVTALLPLVLFPGFGVVRFQTVAQEYANKYIFLFMGGFMLAIAMQRWNLHRRIALLTVLSVGTSPRQLVAGFMLATAFLSMWISNTATTVMMLPIGLSLIELFQRKTDLSGSAGLEQSFGVCLMLGIAYAASIGGMATLVGTPPNALLAGYLHQRGILIGFAEWMFFALPLALVLLITTWFLLTRILFSLPAVDVSTGASLIRAEWKKLGPMSRPEWLVLSVFMATAAAWILRKPLANWEVLSDHVPLLARVDDTWIALLAAISLFLIPSDLKRGPFLLDWEAASALPWGVLLLFGGGLSLAAAMEESQLARWIGSQFAEMGGLPVFWIVAAVALTVIFFTEITSNLATVSALLPVLFAVARGGDLDPLWLLVPAALAASCAFMLPVATPPNAIVFGSGHIRTGAMVRTGFWLNVVAAVLIPLFVYSCAQHFLPFRQSNSP
ncbi:MAG: anion transporter [Planctomycetaceae bacterium]|nr:anion transporter [Planctomycetaceae bacterium]